MWGVQYDGAYIQLLDLPGIIEGASQGKGRGKQVGDVIRNAVHDAIMLDLILFLLVLFFAFWGLNCFLASLFLSFSPCLYLDSHSRLHMYPLSISCMHACRSLPSRGLQTASS